MSPQIGDNPDARDRSECESRPASPQPEAQREQDIEGTTNDLGPRQNGQQLRNLKEMKWIAIDDWWFEVDSELLLSDKWEETARELNQLIIEIQSRDDPNADATRGGAARPKRMMELRHAGNWVFEVNVEDQSDNWEEMSRELDAIQTEQEWQDNAYADVIGKGVTNLRGMERRQVGGLTFEVILEDSSDGWEEIERELKRIFTELEWQDDANADAAVEGATTPRGMELGGKRFGVRSNS